MTSIPRPATSVAIRIMALPFLKLSSAPFPEDKKTKKKAERPKDKIQTAKSIRSGKRQ